MAIVTTHPSCCASATREVPAACRRFRSTGQRRKHQVCSPVNVLAAHAADAAEYRQPKSLPSPPESVALLPVLRYIVELVRTEDGNKAWRLFAAVLALIVSKATGLVAPFFFKRAVDVMAQGEAGAAACVLAVFAFGMSRIISIASKELQQPLFAPLAQSLGRRVAHHTFAHVLSLDISFHLNRQTGVLSRVLNRGTRSVQSLFRSIVFTFMPIVVEMIIVCCTLSTLFNPVVVGVVVATFLAYVFWTERYISQSAEVRKVTNDLDDRSTGKAVDALLNYEAVTLFNNQQLEVKSYDTFLQNYYSNSRRLEVLGSILNAGQGIILQLGIVGALVAAVYCSAKPVTPGDLVLIQVVLLQLWGPLQFLGWFSRELRQSLVDMEAFLGILKTNSALEDGPLAIDFRASATANAVAVRVNGAESSHNGASADLSGAQASIAAASTKRGLQLDMEDVEFGYTPARQVLNGLTLQVEAGEQVAVVGPSGSGKSTVLKLTARLYDPTAGVVKVGGIDVRQLTKSSLRSTMAVVPQDTVLFNDTILENIRYGKPSATDEEVIAAASMAQLDATISSLPDGFATLVGERGLKLSGGEKQRVAIARAFLQDPLILICDEATSALDTATEQGILNSLDELAKGRTSIFVAHRLSTIKSCDKIIVLSEGRMVEQGSHAALLAAGGVYADMWEMQAGEEDARVQSSANGAHASKLLSAV